jgi:hypothetical protein
VSDFDLFGDNILISMELEGKDVFSASKAIWGRPGQARFLTSSVWNV